MSHLDIELAGDPSVEIHFSLPDGIKKDTFFFLGLEIVWIVQYCKIIFVSFSVTHDRATH
jgi:hypothetical protein